MTADLLDPSALDRFLAKFVRGEPDECWHWTAGTSTRGYGVFRADGRQHLAHRLAYRLFVGEIPEGLTIDHLCRVRACVNPWHLEPVTRGENVLRGVGPSAQNHRKDRCPRGHEYDLVSSGRRRCLRCKRERYAERKAAR